MKTKQFSLIMLTLMLAFGVHSHAQMHFGVRNGLALTTLSAKGDLYNDDNLTYSYTAGVFNNIQIFKPLAFQTEINYVRKGRSGETNELNTNLKTDYMLHYLQIPAILQYRNTDIFQKEGSALYLGAGPYASFLISNKTKYSNDTEGVVPEVDKSSKVDWGITFGVGCMLPVVAQKVNIDLRYDMGLSEIEFQPTDYRTKSLSLTAGIMF